MLYVFADSILDTRLYRLYRSGRLIRLRPKVFQVLMYLLEHRDRVVPKQELCEQVWPVPVVSDATLENCLSAVRRAVGDSGRAQRIIQTCYGHGYRFVADVETRSEASAGEAVITASAGPLSTEAVEQSTPVLAVSRSPGETPWSVSPGIAEQKIGTVMSCAPQVRQIDPHGLQKLSDRVRCIVSRYGGTLYAVTGDHILAVFGAPVAQEDHAQRAVLAALELHQGIPLPSELPAVAIGLHTGGIAVEETGAERGTVMLGDTATFAVALQKGATAGAIQCSETTARLVRSLVRLQPLQPVALPDRATLIRAYKILARRPPRVSAGLTRTWGGRPFVGRTQELAVLRTLWQDVRKGHGHVLGIVAEPGMGKSRLVSEFCRSLGMHPYTYWQGRCLSYGQGTPYLPLLDLLRQSCGIMDADRPESLAAKVHRRLVELGMDAQTGVPYLLALLKGQAETPRLAALSPETRKAHTFDILLQMHLRQSYRQPYVLEVENLHWIDATSEAFLSALVERLAGVPILVLVTFRPGYQPSWLDKSYATQLALTRLAPEDSRRIARAMLAPQQVSEPLMQEIITKADGNPFFLEELARSVLDEGALQTALTVPDTIQAVLTARIDRLPATAKRLLQVMSVIGRQVPFSLLGAVTDLSEAECQRALSHLQRVEFLYEMHTEFEPVHAFKHMLIHDAAYWSLLPRSRRYYHRRIAEVLASQFAAMVATQPERLAHHYTEAGLYEQAIAYWQQSGRLAAARSANVEAAGHFAKALDLLKLFPDTPARHQQELTLQIGLGAALTETKGLAAPEVEHAYTRAHALCQQSGETQLFFPVLWGLRKFYMARGDLRAAHKVAEEFFARAQQQPASEPLLMSHQAMGITLYYLGDLNDARVHLEQMRALYEPTQHANQTGPWITNSVGIGLGYDALVLWYLGYPDRSLQRNREALTLVQEAGDPLGLAPVLFFTASLYLLRREVDRVQQYAEALISLATEQGFQYRLAQGMIMHGWSLAMQGQTDAGIVQMRQGLEAYEATGARQGRYLCLMYLADVYSHSGQVDTALQVLTEALSAARHTEQWLGMARLYRRQGELLLALQGSAHRTQDPQEHNAEACLLQALETARRLHARSLELRAAMSLSRLWQGQGRGAEARDLLAAIYTWFREGFDTADLRQARALLDTLA